MPRRSLRKADPSLDLTPYLFTLEKIPAPFDATTLFGRNAPLEVEVGSGKGLFISGAAEKQPHHNFFGIEIATKYAAHCAARCSQKKLSNAKMLHGDAEKFFAEWLTDSSVTAVHIYFPDPWWKARHKKRRVVNETMLKNVQRVLIPSGKLHLWTDVEEYYLSSLELISANTTLSGPHPVEETPAAHSLDYRTHFERRTRMNEEPVYRAEFVKVTEAASATA